MRKHHADGYADIDRRHLRASCGATAPIDIDGPDARTIMAGFYTSRLDEVTCPACAASTNFAMLSGWRDDPRQPSIADALVAAAVTPPSLKDFA